MGIKEQAILFKVNEYLKKPEIRKLLVDKIIEASKNPEFKDFLKEDVEQVLREENISLKSSKSSQTRNVVKPGVIDKDEIKKAVKEVLDELEKETKFKEKQKTLGSKFIEAILQTRILDFRLQDLYLRQKGFAWISSVTVVCFILALITRLNNNLTMSRVFLAVGTGLVAGGFLTYYFFARTYKDIFVK